MYLRLGVGSKFRLGVGLELGFETYDVDAITNHFGEIPHFEEKGSA